MRLRALGTLAGALALFVAVYAPAFLAVALLRPRAQEAILLIITISLVMAMALIFVLARRTSGLSAFGFAVPVGRYCRASGPSSALPLAIGAALVAHLFPWPQSHRDSALPLWILTLYFGLAAADPGRDHLQGTLGSLSGATMGHARRVLGVPTSPAVLVAATLFGLVHFGRRPRRRRLRPCPWPPRRASCVDAVAASSPRSSPMPSSTSLV